MNQQAGSHLLHLAVSNQSFAVREAELELKVDGRTVFRSALSVGAQHNWEELTVTLAAGPHTLEASEVKTGAARTERLNVEHELWLTIIFNSPPPIIAIDTKDQQLGLL